MISLLPSTTNDDSRPSAIMTSSTINVIVIISLVLFCCALKGDARTFTYNLTIPFNSSSYTVRVAPELPPIVVAPDVTAQVEIVAPKQHACVSCRGTSISDVTSSCWERAMLNDKRFVSLIQCTGQCSISTINHTAISLVQYNRTCEQRPCVPGCNNHGGTEICKYCCYGDRCNAVIPTFGRNTPMTSYEDLDDVSQVNLRKMLTNLLSRPRQKYNKMIVRKELVRMLEEFGYETETLKFRVTHNTEALPSPFLFHSILRTVVTGNDVIAVLPGRYYQTSHDKIVVITANYDTIEDTATPGVNDNGSGVSMLMELARLFKTKGKKLCTRQFTVVMVASDYKHEGHYSQEDQIDQQIVTIGDDDVTNNDVTTCYTRHFDGLVGDAHFICDWLSPHITNHRSQVLFAISLNTLLNFNSKRKSQRIPRGSSYKTPNLRDFRRKVSRHDYVGDFVLASYSNNDDVTEVERFLSRLNHVMTSSTSRYREGRLITQLFDDGEKYARNLPSQCLPYREIQGINIPCISLTDTGKYRGYMESCYKEKCDDRSHVTNENINFLSKITNAVWESIESIQLESCHPTSNVHLYSFQHNSPQKSVPKCRKPLLNDQCIGEVEDYCQLPQMDYSCHSVSGRKRADECKKDYQIVESGNQIPVHPDTSQIRLRISFGTRVYIHSLQVGYNNNNNNNKFKFSSTFLRRTTDYPLYQQGPRGRGKGAIRRRFNKRGRTRGQSTVTNMQIRVRFNKQRKHQRHSDVITHLTVQFYGCAFP